MADKNARNYPPEVEEKIEELQNPEGDAAGGGAGLPPVLQQLLRILGMRDEQFIDQHKGRQRDENEMSDTRPEDPYYPVSSGNDEQYSSTNLDKTGEEFKLEPPKRKGKKAKPVAPSSLLKNANQVLLSAFFGGVLKGFDKNGWYPEVDPGYLFDSLLNNAGDAVDCTPAEVAEVKTAFIKSWGDEG